MANYPKFVEFREEGPREGFQIEKTIFPIEQRVELINRLSDTGLQQIQVGSFVSPKYVPQMADTALLFDKIERAKGVRYTSLWLNEKGFRQALAAKNVHLDGRLFFYASNEFAKHNNNAQANEVHERQRDWISLYRDNGVGIEGAYIMAAFGCNMQGSIPPKHVHGLMQDIVRMSESEGIKTPNFIIADTMGWATPEAIKRMVNAAREIAPDTRICMHIHDTRGLGITNLHAALEEGVDLFESSVAGLGGCPFAGHGSSRAAGNVCTEDAVFLCHELGLETGIDLEKLIEAANFAQDVIGGTLMGRVMHSGSLAKFRKK